jgi:hypothetical protein
VLHSHFIEQSTINNNHRNAPLCYVPISLSYIQAPSHKHNLPDQHQYRITNTKNKQTQETLTFPDTIITCDREKNNENVMGEEEKEILLAITGISNKIDDIINSQKTERESKEIKKKKNK